MPRQRNPRRGPGYRPKPAASAGGRRAPASGGRRRNPLLPALLVAGIAIAGIAYYWYGRGGTGLPFGLGGSSGNEVTTASGLKYIDQVVGTGASPTPGSTVTLHYTGTLTNGTEFDSSVRRNQPFTYQVGQMPLIKGWSEGVATMKVGGKRRLIIPPELGYGAAGQPPKIPPNATLIFDLELLDVK